MPSTEYPVDFYMADNSYNYWMPFQFEISYNLHNEIILLLIIRDLRSLGCMQLWINFTLSRTANNEKREYDLNLSRWRLKMDRNFKCWYIFVLNDFLPKIYLLVHPATGSYAFY